MKITEAVIDNISNLAKLHLNEEERQKARQDMEEMLDFMEKVKSVDTDGIIPMPHVFSGRQELREDVVTNPDGSEDTLRNAPYRENDMFRVPKTVG